LKWIKTGTLVLNNTRYIFRDDTYREEIWAWEYYCSSHKPVTHKWSKMPRKVEEFCFFDLDNIPPTVSWFPFD